MENFNLKNTISSVTILKAKYDSEQYIQDLEREQKFLVGLAALELAFIAAGVIFFVLPM